MVTRVINGHHVISDDDTPSPIRTNNGHHVVWRQTRTLTLDDGSTIYGCAHCDYVSTNVLSIRPHLAIHRQPEPPSDNTTRLLKNALEAALSDRDRWRDRARKAERALRRLRDALQVTP